MRAYQNTGMILPTNSKYKEPGGEKSNLNIAESVFWHLSAHI